MITLCSCSDLKNVIQIEQGVVPRLLNELAGFLLIFTADRNKLKAC